MVLPSIWYDDNGYLMLVLLVLSIFSEVISVPNITSHIPDVTYDELEDLGANCTFYDNCKFNRTMDLLFDPYTCNCDRSCVKFDTCCLDSKFRKSVPSSLRRRHVNCVVAYGDYRAHVYMVDRCQHNWPKDLVADLCRGDGESRNDPLLLIPSTSQLTGITYKNQFCSICNNDTDATTLWNLKLGSKTPELLSSNSVPSLRYSTSRKTWEMVVKNRNGNRISVPVSLTAVAPEHIQPMVKNCDLHLISNCSRKWSGVDVKQKCAAYMARVLIPRNGTLRSYRNPHCAICNFESLELMLCTQGYSYSGYDGVFFVSLFVLDDKDKKCDKGEVYDSLGKRCRVLKCPSNHSVENGKCVSIK